MSRKLPNVPWIVDGAVDLGKIPLESNYKTALGSNREEALGSLRVIGSASSHNRIEASVSLMGFLVNLPDDDWEMRIAAVEALQHTKTERCTALLFSELRRVKSNNTTRRYLNAIVEVLTKFPAELVQEGFDALAEDTSFSPKMRLKFRLAAEKNLYRNSAW